jgi:hypothetical protein
VRNRIWGWGWGSSCVLRLTLLELWTYLGTSPGCEAVNGDLLHQQEQVGSPCPSQTQPLGAAS